MLQILIFVNIEKNLNQKQKLIKKSTRGKYKYVLNNCQLIF